MWTFEEAGLQTLRESGEYAGTEHQNIIELLGSTVSCRGITTSIQTSFLQEWFLLLWGPKSTVISSWIAVHKEANTSDRYEPSSSHQRHVEGRLKPRRLRQILTGAVTRWRNQALIHCWRPPGVHYNSIKSLVPYTERQMAQLFISSQQPGDSTSPSTFGPAA